MSFGSLFLRDLRFALRSLGRAPGLSLVAIVTLGLGIGANTSMFSVLSSYMFRPPPYPESQRLERIYRVTSADAEGGASPADYLDLRRELGQYGDVSAYRYAEMNLSEPGRPAEMVRGVRASSELFRTLGRGPRLGRAFRPEEEVPGADRVVIISDRFWRDRFGRDPGVLGRTVRIDGEPQRIVGVLPAGFSDWRHLGFVDLYRPLSFGAREAGDRTATDLRLVGRRRPGVGPGRSAAMVESFGRRMTARYPSSHAGTRWRTLAMRDSFLPGYGQAMIGMLVALSGFVLLIACSNLANLLLARTMSRSREFAVRGALGASRAQVLRPLFMESLLLALAGGAFAMAVAAWAFDWMEAQSRGAGGGGFDLVFDWRVVGWTFGACLFTAVAFGVAPALYALRLDPDRVLRGGSRGNSEGRGARRFRGVLIVGQFALALVLLAGAASFIRGLRELSDRRFGWRSDHLVTGSVLLPPAAYPDGRAITAFQRRAVERLEALPGVASASAAYTMPFFGLSEARRYVVAGRPTPRPGEEPSAVINGVAPRYFETLGTRLVAGRDFTPADDAGAPRVFIISQAMAEQLFPGEDALGRRIAQVDAAGPVWGEIVGIVGNVGSVFAERVSHPYQLYQPAAQEPRPLLQVAVRGTGIPPEALVASVRAALMELDADLPVRQLQPAEVSILQANYGIGVLRSILSALGLLGLGLASLGIYGVIARAVAQRTNEFGIRLALGAQPADVARLVLGSGVRVAALGSSLGLLGAVGLTRLIGSAFPNLHPGGAPALAAVCALLVAVALVACYLPARRAARINPADALAT